MDADLDRRRHVRLRIIEKSRSMSLDPQSRESQLVDRRIGLAHSNLVAVDDVVKDVGKVHHRPPTFAKLAHVVRQHTQTKSGVAKLVHERDDRLVGDEVERDRLARFGFG